jgi:hypothetical protein
MKKLKLQFKKFKIKNLVFLFCISLVFLPTLTSAAGLRLDSSAQEFGVNRTFQVDFVLNAEGELLNALEGQIVFPTDLLELREIREGNSIISLWVEQPKLIEAGKITFSGIIPGGYNEKDGYIFSAIFLGRKEGQGLIAIKQSQVLKNDGLGTPASVKVADFSFSIFVQPKTITPEPAKIVDYDQPESFKPAIAKSQDVFDGQNFLVFSTKDKGSGMARYEVRESRQWSFYFLAKWREAASPYLLTDQELKSYVFVKAVDLNGNGRIELISPRYQLSWYENYSVYVIIIASIIVFLILWKISRRKRRAKIN